MVGEWTDQSPDATIESNVTWTKNKTFLSYAFKASVPGMDDLEGTQVIGWDPEAGTIRSWMFDSDGGFGEGIWSKKDNCWIVKFSQVLPDGRKASATNIYTLVDAKHVHLEVDRPEGGWRVPPQRRRSEDGPQGHGGGSQGCREGGQAQSEEVTVALV